MADKVTKTIDKLIEAFREEQGNLSGDDDIIKIFEDGSDSYVNTFNSERLNYNGKEKGTSVYQFKVKDEDGDEYEVIVEAELFDDYEEQVEAWGEDGEKWDDFDLDAYYNSSKFANYAARQLIEELEEWKADYIKYYK